MLSPESESDVDSSDGGNGPSLNSEGVRSGSVPQKCGVIRNNLEDGEMENSESDPDVKQSRKRHRVSSGDKRANAGDSVRYLVDDEAEESGDEAHSDDGEESDGERDYEYLKDGFVVEDDGSDGGSGSNSGSDVEFSRRKKKLTRLRRTHDEGGMLDDDDIALLEETHALKQGIEHGHDQQAALRASNARDLESQLFADEPGDEKGESAGAGARRPTFQEEDYQSEDEDDFIEDDVQMYTDAKLRKAASYDSEAYGHAGGPTQDQLLEAMEIFGEGIVEHLKGQQPSSITSREGERRVPAAASAAAVSVAPRIEPGKLQESFVSPQDKIIQTKDWPERLQIQHLRSSSAVVSEASANNWEREAIWIYSEMKDALKVNTNNKSPPPAAAASNTGWGDGGVEEKGRGGEATATALDSARGDSNTSKQKIISVIGSVLVLLRVEGMEVPFIFNHRPDSFKPELDLGNLWQICDLDEKWQNLTIRRQNISLISNSLWNKKAETTTMNEKMTNVVGDGVGLLSSTTTGNDDIRKEDGITTKTTEKSIMLPIIEDTLTLFPKEIYEKLLLESDDETLLRDLQAYLSLVTLRNKFTTSSSKKESRNRASRQDEELYRKYRNIPELRKFCLSFAIPAYQLGGFLDHPYEAIPPPVPLHSPELTILRLGDACGFKTDDAAFQAVINMLAYEISREPRILGRCRKIFRDRATLSTAPTDLGKQEIDYFHTLYGIHYIHRKPIMELLKVNGSKPENIDANSLLSDPRILMLRLESGRKDGLITIKINPPLCRSLDSSITSMNDNNNPMGLNQEPQEELDVSPFIHELAPLYGAGKELSTRSEWEIIRFRVLEIAVRRMVPPMIAELIRELRKQANDCVAEKVGESLAMRLDVAPWAPEDQSAEERLTNDAEKRRVLDEIRIAGIYISPDPRQPSYAAVIDHTGVALDHLILPARREEVPAKLKEFFMDNRPDVVAVGASPSPQTRYIKKMLYTHRRAQLEGGPDTMSGVIPEALEDYKSQRDEESVRWYPEWRACGVEFVCEDVALVFSASVRSAQEFPDFHPNHRAAICLARYLQNPLIELAGMWMTMDSQGELGSEMLSLQFHPLQKEIPRRRVLRVLEQKLIDFVNMVGVDINCACKLEHMSGVIQFIAGLGPRKALRLKSGILSLPDGVVHSRQHFLEEHLLGPHVYTNASATLRVRRGMLESGERLNPFDDTRIHPECYVKHKWARQICANAIDVDGDDYIANFYAVVDDSHEKLVATLQHNDHWDPATDIELQDKLEELDLEEFASDMEKQGLGMRRLQLEAIKNEIRFPYRELRHPFQTPTPDQLFQWIIGETDMSLRPGVVLPIRITGHIQRGMKAKVEGFGSLYGFIQREAIPGGEVMDETDIQRAYPRNQVFDAAVVEVLKDRFEVLLSLRPSEVKCPPRDLSYKFPRPLSLPPVDNHFKEYEAICELEARTEEREKLIDENRRGRKVQVGTQLLTASKLISRFRAHDNFKACTYSEAEDTLKDGTVGDMLVRPSSKGVEHLGLTWMWLPNSFKHIDVHGKTEDDGRLVLWIEGEGYEDLDEVLARYITPCNDYVSEVLLHEKYHEAPRADCEKYLEEQKKSHPNRIPYLITKHRSVPAHFVIAYLPGKTVKREYVKVMPGGYEMGSELFPSIKALIRYFKTNVQEKFTQRQHHQQQEQQRQGGGVLPKPPLPPGPPPPPRDYYPPLSGMGMVRGGQKVQPPPPTTAPPAVSQRQYQGRRH